MSPEEIKLELFKRRRKTSQAAIAREVGVTRQAVEAVITRRFVSERIMRAVAEAIERDPKYVWPERFLKAK